ncbi:chromosome segregation protein SMC [Alicyclobacillus curvatus]|nr:chromosome segregation protein SMC [Alicyclobacillus curvatus]
MFLKRIDVTGFKSFADHTEIAFSPGITAVVGPNGSGKSNIADAIRWVLGEQSARTLRGAKMEDVIFAGSESRRAINYCEVSLTLDNVDKHLGVVFDEVTVTRRMYRSGESEYLINKQSCRLKDIAELFMDSGMGRESYSIIGQGKIEEMLSTRAEDRRGAFEDAAGIVKFKFRKREAERRLAETDQNITRVDDILDELERQAGPLEAEANRARAFQLLQEEHRALDIGLLVSEIEEQTQRWKQAQATSLQAGENRDAARLLLAEVEQTLAVLRRNLENHRQSAEALQRQHVDAIERRERLQGELALHQERAKNGSAAIEDREKQLTGLAEERSELQSDLERVLLRENEITGQIERKQGELETAAHAVDPGVKARLEGDIARLNEEYIELHHHSAGFRNEIKMAEEYLAQDSQKRERLTTERNRFAEDEERLVQELTNWQAKVEDQQNELQELMRRQEELSHAQTKQTEAEAATVADIHRAESETASLVSRLELLTELENGYDGYALGAKTVLQAASKDRLTGIHGPIAGLIQVQKSHEVAIETALGGALQNIVVDHEAAGRAAIDLLKQRHAGRATFLPLSVVRSRLLQDTERSKLTGQAGVVGIASDLVDCDAKYRQVIEHLLGNVVVTDNLVHANQAAKILNYRVRIVSLEGDVVSPGGAMTGGSISRKGPGLLGRSRERQEVERLINERRATVTALREKQQELRQIIEQTTDKQRESSLRINEIRSGLESARSGRQDASNRLESVQDRLQTLDWEISELAVGHTGWQERLKTARQGLTDVLAAIETTEKNLADARRTLLERETSLSEAQDALTAIRVELATLMQEQSTVEQQIADLRARIHRLSMRLQQLEHEIRDLDASRETELRAAEGAAQTLTEVEGDVAELEQKTTAVRQEVQQMESDVVDLEKTVRRRQQELSSTEEQVHRAEVAEQRIDGDLKHALNRMGEAHKMTFEWAREHHRLDVPVAAAKQRAEQLQRQMNQMGQVHLGAIEEWERISERLQFLTRERTDLRQAEEQLQSVIAELDEEMSKRFEETFEAIRNEFRVSFRQLFGGGKADLTLTDPTDLLQTGIEVIAQPPGKKLQNLNLLSGGERALTAMALLFAILRVRPVPFCVLDEVEAALDEANVGRFAQQLRSFSDETQFIVVTHRRGTMEEADALYGVTMQESGVSALIGVRLEDQGVDPDMETA